MATIYEYPLHDENGNYRWATINGGPVKVYEPKPGNVKKKKDEEKEKVKVKDTKSETKKEKEKDIIKDAPEDPIADDKKYYNPNTGEGPYTKKDMEGLLEREFQYLKPEEYSPYLQEDLVDNYTEKFMRDNGLDINDKAEYKRVKDDILENPEYYMEWEDISEAKEHYLDDHGTRESDWMGKGEEIPEPKSVGSKEPVMQYESAYRLASPVNDYDAAVAYLQSDDMTQYLPEDLKEPISSVEWQLDDDETGRVVVKTNRELTEDEAQSLKDWIDGQNSDGLGEGFEQQEFATSYWNPETGEGPFTYREFEQEQERMYDELEPYEYADYLDRQAVDDAAEAYMNGNGYDLDDEDLRIEARDAVMEDPEEYLDWEDIAHAKDEYFKEMGGSNEEEWYAMSSMRRDGEITGTSISPQVETAEPTLKEKYEYLNQKGINELNNFTSDNDDTFIRKEYDKQIKADRYTQLKEKFNRGEIEPYSAEDYELRDLKYQKAIDDGILTQEEVDYLKTKEDWQMDKASRADVDKAKHYMEEAERNKTQKQESVEGYINKAAESQRTEPRNQKEQFVRDLEKEWEDGGSLKDMYEAHKSEAQSLGMSQEEFKDELKGINQAETWGEDWFHEDDKSWGSGNKKQKGLNNAIEEFVKNNPDYENGTYNDDEFLDIADYMDLKDGDDAVDRINDAIYDWENRNKPKTTNDIMNGKIKGGVEEARNKHQNIYMETEKDASEGYKHYNDDIIKAHDNFEKFKAYETFTNDEWNNASKEQQQKLAKDSLVNFFKDNKMDEEEMLDFQDELRNNNFHTESEQIEEAYNETIGKATKANSKSISDNLSRAAYNKYLKEHPGSNMTFEQFKKSKKQ